MLSSVFLEGEEGGLRLAGNLSMLYDFARPSHLGHLQCTLQQTKLASDRMVSCGLNSNPTFCHVLYSIFVNPGGPTGRHDRRRRTGTTASSKTACVAQDGLPTANTTNILEINISIISPISWSLKLTRGASAIQLTELSTRHLLIKLPADDNLYEHHELKVSE